MLISPTQARTREAMVHPIVNSAPYSGMTSIPMITIVVITAYKRGTTLKNITIGMN